MWTPQYRRAAGEHYEGQPCSLSYTLSHADAGEATGTAKQTRQHAANEGLLTPSLSRPFRGRAAVAAESSSSRQRGSGMLRAGWRSSPALWPLILLGSPEIGVLWTWVSSLETGAYF